MTTRLNAAFLTVLAITLAACAAAVPAPSASAPRVAAEPSREPAHIERLPREQVVLDAFTAAAIKVTLIGGSHSERQLGRPLPARAFIAAPEGDQGAIGAGADVLFLPQDGRWDIRVCETPSTGSGRYRYEIRVRQCLDMSLDVPRRGPRMAQFTAHGAVPRPVTGPRARPRGVRPVAGSRRVTGSGPSRMDDIAKSHRRPRR